MAGPRGWLDGDRSGGSAGWASAAGWGKEVRTRGPERPSSPRGGTGHDWDKMRGKERWTFPFISLFFSLPISFLPFLF
jgi:hypothetical protein